MSVLSCALSCLPSSSGSGSTGTDPSTCRLAPTQKRPRLWTKEINYKKKLELLFATKNWKHSFCSDENMKSIIDIIDRSVTQSLLGDVSHLLLHSSSFLLHHRVVEVHTGVWQRSDAWFTARVPLDVAGIVLRVLRMRFAFVRSSCTGQIS